MISRMAFVIFMSICSLGFAGSIRVSPSELYEDDSGFYFIGESLSNSCLGESLEFHFPTSVVDSDSVYVVTRAFFERKPVSVSYADGKNICEGGDLSRMEVLGDE